MIFSVFVAYPITKLHEIAALCFFFCFFLWWQNLAKPYSLIWPDNILFFTGAFACCP